MMAVVGLTIQDGISPDLLKLIKKSRDLSPAMQKIQLLVMQPLKARAWQESGLKSRSGELEKAVTAWHGKKSAGVSVHTRKGKDLVIPKAVSMTGGSRRHAYKKHTTYKVKSHSRAGRAVREYQRKNPGAPWGAIKARPFIPTALNAMDIQRITKTLEEHLHV